MFQITLQAVLAAMVVNPRIETLMARRTQRKLGFVLLFAQEVFVFMMVAVVRVVANAGGASCPSPPGRFKENWRLSNRQAGDRGVSCQRGSVAVDGGRFRCRRQQQGLVPGPKRVIRRPETGLVARTKSTSMTIIHEERHEAVASYLTRAGGPRKKATNASLSQSLATNAILWRLHKRTCMGTSWERVRLVYA